MFRRATGESRQEGVVSKAFDALKPGVLFSTGGGRLMVKMAGHAACVVGTGAVEHPDLDQPCDEVPPAWLREAGRIVWLQRQPPELRALLLGLAKDPSDRETLGVFCDWLLDAQRDADAQRLDEGWKERLMRAVTAFGAYSAAAAIAPGSAAAREEPERALAEVRRLLGLEAQC
jgi:hypothetical protein